MRWPAGGRTVSEITDGMSPGGRPPGTRGADPGGQPPGPPGEADTDAAVRAVAAIGLIGVGIIHALEMRGQLSGAAWLVVGFGLLAVSAPACALWLLARPGPLPWLGGGLICLSAGLGYVLTRSVGLPGDPGDVGNWLEPLGVTSLITEAVVVMLAAFVLANLTATPRPKLARASAISGSARSSTRSRPY